MLIRSSSEGGWKSATKRLWIIFCELSCIGAQSIVLVTKKFHFPRICSFTFALSSSLNRENLLFERVFFFSFSRFVFAFGVLVAPSSVQLVHPSCILTPCTPNPQPVEKVPRPSDLVFRRRPVGGILCGEQSVARGEIGEEPGERILCVAAPFSIHTLMCRRPLLLLRPIRCSLMC